MNNTTTKVGPLTGIDFSKLRTGGRIHKFQPGGTFTPVTSVDQIPKWFTDRYAQSSLTDWNADLDSSFYTQNKTNHSKAADLLAAYNLMSQYIAGTNGQNNIGADIQNTYSIFGNNGQMSAEDFVTKYNQNIDTLNNFYGQGTSHKYNDDDAGNFNKLYRQMNGSRSDQQTGDIGYDEGVEKYMGSQTWLRRVDNYEKEYDQLTPEEKAARTYTVKIGGKDVKVYKKANGQIALLPDPTVPTPDPTVPTEDPGDNGSKLQAVDYKTKALFNFDASPWTDWIHLANIYQTNRKGINDYYDLLQQQKTPLISPVQQNYRIGSNFIEREANSKAANAMMANARRNATASDEYNAELFDRANAARLQTEEQNNKILQTKVNQDNENAQNIENWNTQQRVSSSNTDLQNLTDYHNQRLQYQAARKYALAEQSADFQNKLDASHQKWLSNVRQDRQQAIKDYNTAEQNRYLTVAWEKYQKAYEKPFDDYALEVAYDYINGAQTYTLTPEEQQKVTGITDPTILAEYIKNNPDSTLGKQATQFQQDDIDAAERDYFKSQRNAKQYALDLIAYQPRTITGEGTWTFDKIDKKALWDPKAKALSFKKGGRFLEYLEHNRKVYKDMDENVNRESSRNVKLLQTQLNAINQQTIALLRSIFK